MSVADSINSYLDVEIGAACIIADDVYIADFDHAYGSRELPVKDQGIVKVPVRIGDDVWLGTTVTVAKGVAVGDGCVVGANAVVTRDLPAYSVAVGAPAVIIRRR